MQQLSETIAYIDKCGFIHSVKEQCEYINQYCEIDVNSVYIDAVNAENRTYGLHFDVFNGEINEMAHYDIIVPFDYDMDEDEDGLYIDNIYTNIESFKGLKYNEKDFSKIHRKIYDEIDGALSEKICSDYEK